MSKLPRPLRHQVVAQLDRLLTLREFVDKGAPLTRAEREELEALEIAMADRARWLPDQLDKAAAKVRTLSQKKWRVTQQLEAARKRVARLKAELELRP